MTLALYAHPLSGYCWKVLIALYETQIGFDYRSLADPEHHEAWQRLSPTKRMPILVDNGKVVAETSIIIEHLDLHHEGAGRLIPRDPAAALRVRLLDRLADDYLNTPMQQIVFNQNRPEESRDPYGVAHAREALGDAYRWWDGHMQDREWAADTFGLADCAAAPALFYADWVEPIPATLDSLKAYRARLLARPSVARVVDEARPFRSLFPFGDPGRD